MFRYVLFDLDNTLYPQTCGLWEAIGQRINLLMINRLKMDPCEANRKRDSFMKAFGTTLSALQHYYGVEPDEFFAFVHDIPLTDYLRPEPALDEMLGRLPLAKAIFTNADASHARRVLSCLGVSRHFERIIDIHALEFINKPNLRAYLMALEFISAGPEECIFVEDSIANLRPARQLGMFTVLVHDGDGADGADRHVRNITDLEGIIKAVVRA